MSGDPVGTPTLRAALLSSKPSDFGLASTPELPHVWATLMEMRIGDADVSLVAVADGSTSLYVSNGGGIIGAGQHETVRAASRKLLVVTEKLLAAFVVRDAPVPVLKGAVSFTVLTYEGLRTARDTEERVQQKKSPLWPAYWVGQEVITNMRLATEKMPH